MGHYNRQLVRTTMSWERVAKQLEEIYEKTLQRVASTRYPQPLREAVQAERTSAADAQEAI
jgi:hypothetical protein